jgi:hypothetical protein
MNNKDYIVIQTKGVVIMKNITSSIINFEKLRQKEYLYIDKTEYIWNLINPAGESYFLSRPRRFGKSLAVSTLKAVFEGKKELFKGLAIYDKPYDWKSYSIIHLDFANCDINTANELIEYLTGQLENIATSFHLQLRGEQLSGRFENLINDIAANGDVVILVDEYDKPILNNITNPGVHDILKVLKGFYSNIKKVEGKLRFAFITGVSKFCHVSLFSDLNNLTDITMDARYATMFGFTQEELEANFSDRIVALAVDKDIEAYKAEIKDWYNGYRFEENAKTVYNPVSLVRFFESQGKFKNYWFSTGTPSFLMELAKESGFNFRSVIGGESVSEIAFSAFEIDNIDPITLLLQTGYATIKGTEQMFGQTWYFLDFPNKEVATAFSTYILNSYAGKKQTDTVRFVADFANCLLQNNLPKLRQTLEVFFAGVPYDVHKKNEAIFQGIFFSIFRLLGEYIDAESTTNDGRIDAVVETSSAIYIFEFKLDNDPTALEQIKEKEYYKKYSLDKREIYIIGVNFDSVKGNLIGWEDENVEK